MIASALLEIGAGIRSAINRRIEANLRALKDRTGAAPPVACWTETAAGTPSCRSRRSSRRRSWCSRSLAEDDVLNPPGVLFRFPPRGVPVLSLLPETAAFEEALGRILTRVDRR